MKELVPLVFGLACTSVSVVWGGKRWKRCRGGVRTTGTVVEFSVSGLLADKSYTPVVEYKNDTGQTIRFRGSTGTSGFPAYRQGQIVKVIYSRQNPGDAQIANFEQLWLGPAAFALFGLVALGLFFFG